MSHVEEVLRSHYAAFRDRYPALPPCVSYEPEPVGDWAIAHFVRWEAGCPVLSFDVLSLDQTPTLYHSSHEYAHALHYAGGGDPRVLFGPGLTPLPDPVMDAYFRIRGLPISYMDHVEDLRSRVRAGGTVVWGMYPGEMFAESVAAVITGETERAMTYEVAFTPERRAAVDAFARALVNRRDPAPITSGEEEEDMSFTDEDRARLARIEAKLAAVSETVTVTLPGIWLQRLFHRLNPWTGKAASEPPPAYTAPPPGWSDPLKGG